jgi:hypothetical protein
MIFVSVQIVVMNIANVVGKDQNAMIARKIFAIIV